MIVRVMDLSETRDLPRRGLTLLEVIVAMAIFLIALGAIVPLIQMGQLLALEIQVQSLALAKCQSKISEVMAGSELLSSQNDSTFPENTTTEDWRWSMQADATDVNNLWLVKVTVYRMMDSDKIEVSLTQMVFDPAFRGGPTLNTAAMAGGGG